jgi:hypothetical protein
MVKNENNVLNLERREKVTNKVNLSFFPLKPSKKCRTKNNPQT